jgi:NAD+ synthase
MANTRSRLRMTALYAMATHFKLLVAGTGNKIEDFGVGFFTKYGDGGVDIAPIADLLKTEVYEVARHLGILQKIIDAPPTDGLWPDSRTDESQIGASYPELEWAMTVDLTDQGESAFSKRQREVLAIYRRFNRANQHKMDPIPVCRIPESLR